MNKNESKYYNTALLMDEALIELLDKKSLEYITVKEICSRAGVNRSTFYLHYESIDDLVSETLEYINKKFIDYFDTNNLVINNIENSNKEELYLIQEKYLIPYLNFIKDNKMIFKASLNNTHGGANIRYSHMEREIFYPILNKYEVPDNEKEYILNFYIYGIIAVIKCWLLNNCKDKIEDISNIITKCIKNG